MWHTKGPWFVEKAAGANLMIIDSVGCCIGVVFGFINLNRPAGPNANLIATAPDLLMAAKRAIGRLEDLEQWTGYDSPSTIGELSAAIAKAEGRTP